MKTPTDTHSLCSGRVSRSLCSWLFSKHCNFLDVFLLMCRWQIAFNKEREGRQLMVMSAASLDLTVEASSGGNGKGRGTDIEERYRL